MLETTLINWDDNIILSSVSTINLLTRTGTRLFEISLFDNRPKPDTRYQTIRDEIEYR